MVEAALALQPGAEELNIAAGVTLRAADTTNCRAAGERATNIAAGASPVHEAADLHVESHYILMKGAQRSPPIAGQKPRLGLLMLQVRMSIETC